MAINAGSIKVSFSECKSFVYDAERYNFYIDSNGKKWRMLIENINMYGVDIGKWIYIYQRDKNKNNFKKDERNAKLIYKLKTVIVGKIINKYKECHLDKDKETGVVYETLQLNYADRGTAYEHFFILSEMALTKERLDQIAKEIDQGYCPRATKVDFALDTKNHNIGRSDKSSGQFYRDSGTLFKKKEGVEVVLIDFIDHAYHLHVNFMVQRYKYMDHGLKKGNYKYILDEIVYQTLKNAEGDNKKYNDYKNCLKIDKHQQLVSQFKKDEIDIEEILRSMGKYAENLCAVLSSEAFRNAMNDYLFASSDKAKEKLMADGCEKYCEIISQLDTTPYGLKYLDNEFQLIESELQKIYKEREKNVSEDKILEVEDPNDLKRYSPVVKFFCSLVGGSMSLLLERYKTEITNKLRDVNIKYKVKYSSINEVLNHKGLVEQRCLFFEKAIRTISRKNANLENKNIVIKIFNRMSMQDLKKNVTDLKKDIEFFEPIQKEINKTMGKTNMKLGVAGLATAGSAAISLYGIYTFAMFKTYNDLSIENPKEAMKLASNIGGFVGSVADGFKLLGYKAIIRTGTKSANAFTLFSKIAGKWAPAINVIVGAIDAGIAYNDWQEYKRKGDTAKEIISGVTLGGTVATIIGSIIIMLVTAGVVVALAKFGMILLIGGILICLICAVVDLFIDNNEMSIWLLHSPYGKCFSCNLGDVSQCSIINSLPKGYCRLSDFPKWTKNNVWYKNDEQYVEYYQHLVEQQY